MDARDLFLYLHHAVHFTGKAQWTLDPAMQVHHRTVLPGHNSIAWCIWHIARGEDWTIQTILQEREQLLTRDGWGERMGVSYPGFGGGMARAEMIALSERIDLGALRGYYHAVSEATRISISNFDFDRIDEELDVERLLALAPEALGPSPFMHDMIPRWKTARVWLEVFALVDVALHIGDADHVLNLILPARDVD